MSVAHCSGGGRGVMILLFHGWLTIIIYGFVNSRVWDPIVRGFIIPLIYGEFMTISHLRSTLFIILLLHSSIVYILIPAPMTCSLRWPPDDPPVTCSPDDPGDYIILLLYSSIVYILIPAPIYSHTHTICIIAVHKYTQWSSTVARNASCVISIIVCCSFIVTVSDSYSCHDRVMAQSIWIIETALTLYDPGGGFKSPPLRFFALTHLILELHYCALVTFPKK